MGTRTDRRTTAWPAGCVLAVLLLAAGCVGPYARPGEVDHVRLQLEDSPTIDVVRSWFERRDGTLVLTGYVEAVQPGTDTTNAQLIVTFRDRNGVELKRETVNFEPRQVPPKVRLRGGVSYFVLTIPESPTAIDTITIAATAR